MRTLLALAITALFLASPVAAQQPGLSNPSTSTETVLYMHLDGIQDFPINTQAPDDRYIKGESFGAATHTLSCIPTVDDVQELTGSTYHTYYGYSTPGYVEYNFEENGGPRYHRERGLSYDVKLDTAAPASVMWYMESMVTTSEGQQNTVPAIIPNIVVRAIIREGDAVGLGDEKFNEGNIIAEGRVSGNLMADATEGEGITYYDRTDGRKVYGFEIPLTFKSDIIPGQESYNIRIDAYVDNPACTDPTFAGGDQYLMTNNLRPFTAVDARPHISLSVLNPIRIDYLHPMFIGDDLVIHTSMNSPWGNYDVAEDEGYFATDGGITIEISGPSPATSLSRTKFEQRHHEHNHHQEPVDVTWIWPYKADGAKNGMYTVTLRVMNDAQNAEAVGVAQFEIGRGTVIGCGDSAGGSRGDCEQETQPDGAPTQDSPGLELFVLVGLLAAVALLRRRK